MTEALWRLKDEIARDRLSIISAGVAFYMLLAVFPLLGALISIYGLMFDPSQVTAQLSTLEGVIPQQAMEALLGQFKGLKQAGNTALGFGLAGALLIALWSASSGVKATMEALNVAYDERERRGFFKRSGVALLLTLGAIIGAMVAIGVVVVLPAVVRFVGLGSILGGVLAYIRWPVLALAAIIAFDVLYRYGPSRDPARRVWLSWGAVIAAALWIFGSALFSWYVSNFGKYNETYGAVAAVVILLLWFLLSAYSMLIGAEINADLEQQQRRNNTAADNSRPIGQAASSV